MAGYFFSIIYLEIGDESGDPLLEKRYFSMNEILKRWKR